MASIRALPEQPDPHLRPETDSLPGEGQPVRKLTYSPREAATALGVSEALIGKLYRSGRIPVVYVGTLPRIPIAELEKWCRQQYEEIPR